MNHLHDVAAALGCQAAGQLVECAVCGDSPYPTAGPLRKTIGKNFADCDCFRRPGCESICSGCVTLLSGKPGRQPPPLRMTSIALHCGTLRLLKTDQIWPFVLSVQAGERVVLSWAVSRKKHHILRAAISSKDHWLIGSDSTQIEFIPRRDEELVAAIADLLSDTGKGRPSFSRAEIVNGNYKSERIHKFGAGRWQCAETVVARWRGNMLVDFLASVLPVTQGIVEEEDMVADADLAAAEFLGYIAKASEMRREDGIGFWNGIFRHRVQRFAALDLPECVSRLITELRCDESSHAVQDLVIRLRELDEESQRKVEESIRRRTGLVVALAYDKRK